MKKLFFAAAFLLLTSSLFAQDVLLKQDVAADSVKTKFGPNRSHYRHFYVGYGLIIGEPDKAGSAVNYGSNTFTIGFRFKQKVCNLYSVGFNIAYTSYTYRLKQDSNKTVPNSMLHDKEHLSINTVGVGLYNRFNFGRRGDRIGKFVDLGVHADWVFGGKHFTSDKQDNGNIIETTIKRLKYFNNYQYGAFVNIGFNRYVFTAVYRLSDLFEKSYTYSELPRLTVGIQIGFHK